jgi:hypothetical protein
MSEDVGSRERGVATGALMDAKIRFFRMYVGSPRDLAEMIRDYAGELIEELFYYHIGVMLENEGVDPDKAFENEEVVRLLSEIWDDLKHDLIAYVLNRFAEHVVREYGLNGMADRYLYCWSSTEGLMCRFERKKAVEDFKRVALNVFAEVAEEHLSDLIPDIIYVFAESELQGK